MVRQLVERYDFHRDIVDNYDIYVLPVVNPDGYEYTFTNNRMWRKTRSNPLGFASNSLCVGVDPNRNWSHQWGGKGASKNPCSETYRGTRPFSESETDAVQKFIMPRARQFKLFMTFHSYGQFLLFPWGYERHQPDNYQDLEALAEIGAQAMYQTGGHSYTIELPDSGIYGFLLPASRIVATARETHAGITAMIRALQAF